MQLAHEVVTDDRAAAPIAVPRDEIDPRINSSQI
jgi:hypothetical protein